MEPLTLKEETKGIDPQDIDPQGMNSGLLLPPYKGPYGKYDDDWATSWRRGCHFGHCPSEEDLEVVRRITREKTARMLSRSPSEKARETFMTMSPKKRRRLTKEYEKAESKRRNRLVRKAIMAVWNGNATPEQRALEARTGGRIAECGGTGKCRGRCTSCVAAKTCHHQCWRHEAVEVYEALERKVEDDGAEAHLDIESAYFFFKYDRSCGEEDRIDIPVYSRGLDLTDQPAEGPFGEMDIYMSEHFSAATRERLTNMLGMCNEDDRYCAGFKGKPFYLEEDESDPCSSKLYATHVSFAPKDKTLFERMHVPSTECTGCSEYRRRLFCPCDDTHGTSPAPEFPLTAWQSFTGWY